MMKIHVLNKLFLVVCFSWCFYGYSNNNPNEAIDKILTELVSEIKEVKSSYEKTNTILLKKLQDNKNNTMKFTCHSFHIICRYVRPSIHISYFTRLHIWLYYLTF